MLTDTIKGLIDRLSWDEDPARQDEAVALLVAAGDRLDLSLILRRGDKSLWQNEARVLLLLGYPRFREVVPGMMEWLQDLSWPGSSEIIEAFGSMAKDELEGHVSTAVERALATGDTDWLFGLRHLAAEAGLKGEMITDNRVSAALFDGETVWLAYPDGSRIMVGDSVLLERGLTPGVVELIVTSAEQMKEIDVEQPGVMLRSPPFGLVYLPRWSLEEEPLIFVSRESHP